MKCEAKGCVKKGRGTGDCLGYNNGSLTLCEDHTLLWNRIKAKKFNEAIEVTP
jgi:hypothetical protein